MPVSELLPPVVRACAPHAQWLRCVPELVGTDALAQHTGASRQRAVALRPQGLRGVLRALHMDFAKANPQHAEPVGV